MFVFVVVGTTMHNDKKPRNVSGIYDPSPNNAAPRALRRMKPIRASMSSDVLLSVGQSLGGEIRGVSREGARSTTEGSTRTEWPGYEMMKREEEDPPLSQLATVRHVLERRVCERDGRDEDEEGDEGLKDDLGLAHILTTQDRQDRCGDRAR